MLNRQDILNLYRKYNVNASKRFGQNFLHNDEIIKKIIEEANIKDKDVIEIGPGLGSLTMALLPMVKTLIAYEIDKDMIRVISGEINNPKLQLIDKDFLDEDFFWQGKKDVVANIPYNITSQIIFKILKNISMFSTATLMIQKEVGERIIANHTSKSYGKLSVTIQSLADVKKIVDVPSKSFIPAPKVDSMVVKITFKENNYDKDFFDFIKLAFSQQRKKLTNNLKTKYDVKKVISVLESLNINENIRPQQISVNDFSLIYNKL